MIGVIGPRDSVELAVRVAAELGLGDVVLARAYDVADEAPALARELDIGCQVILFTGRVPYVLACQSGDFRAILDYVPHGGTDLYRALVLVLREHQGRLPVVSLDTIERRTAEETYHDLGLDPPRHVLPLENDQNGSGIRAAADVTEFHARLYRTGEVELCLTCLGSVRTDLERLGIPVVRIEHTRAALREALTRTSLTARLARSEATQTAVAVVDFAEFRARGAAGSPYAAQRSDLRVRQHVLDLAERLQGMVTEGDGYTFVIHTTKGAVEAELERASRGGTDVLWPDQSAGVAVGFGVGDTTASAEENARRALMLHRSTRELHLALTDGSVIRVVPNHRDTVYRLRETDPRILARARDLGVGPLTLWRLVIALRQLDPNAVTARDLARSYGVAPRSALRLLTALEKAGVAAALGIHVAPRAGRPQTVYRVDLSRLLPDDQAATQPVGASTRRPTTHGASTHGASAS